MKEMKKYTLPIWQKDKRKMVTYVCVEYYALYMMKCGVYGWCEITDLIHHLYTHTQLR